MADGGRSWNPIRVVNTSRPFTPLDTSRQRRRTCFSGDLPRLVIREKEGEATNGTAPAVGLVRLPSIGDGGSRHSRAVVRKQFRNRTSASFPVYREEEGAAAENEGGGGGDANGGVDSGDPVERCQWLLTSLTTGSAPQAIRACEEMLKGGSGCGNGRVSREAYLPLSKLFFLLASDDDNDAALLASSLPKDYVAAMGDMTVSEDTEALLNSYGALKFLTHNHDLLEVLCRHGLAQLLVLHLKVLCLEDGDRDKGTCSKGRRMLKNVAFQATSCLRNCLNSPLGQAEFRGVRGVEALDLVAHKYYASREISCNLARLYSVLSQLQHPSSSSCVGSVDALYLMTSRHPESSELVVRTTFALGNVAANSDSGRSAILDHGELLEVLTDVLDTRSQRRGQPESAQLEEDILVKTVRIFANLAVLPAAGQWTATNEKLVGSIVRLLSWRRQQTAGQEAEDQDEDYLLLSVLSAICNLSYYPILHHQELYEGVCEHVFSGDDGVAAEAARAVGNLSRIGTVRSRLGDRGILARLLDAADRDLAHRPTVSGIGGGAGDLRFALVGTFINVVADPGPKDSFLSLGGLSFCLKWLLATRESSDWHLATLLCQLIWNALTGLPAEAVSSEEVADLEEILEELIRLEKGDRLDEESRQGEAGHSEFTSVAFRLLEKASGMREAPP